jgi:hypothetical protein
MRSALSGSVLSWVAVSSLGFLVAGCGASSDGDESPGPSGVGGNSPEVGGSTGGGGAMGTGGSMRGSGGAIGSGGSMRGSGGSSGTGAAIGTGGADGGGAGDASAADSGPPHVVGKCDSLSAVGTWDSITPPGVSLSQTGAFNTGVNAFAFDPNNTATVYLGTCAQGIYKSTDCGATWVHINTGVNGPGLNDGRNWTLEVDPVDSSVYVNSGYGGPGGVLKSTNGGVDWTNLLAPGSEFDKLAGDFVEFIAIDPNDRKHLLVSAHNSCTGVAAGGGTCFANTTDGGATWRMIKGTSEMYFEGLTQTIIDANTWLVFTNGIFVTTDAGSTWTKTPIPATTTNGQLYKHEDGNYYLSADYGLAKSSDGISWSQLRGTPNSASLAADGTTMFTSQRQADAAHRYYVSTGDPTVWTVYPSPPAITNGSWLMRYDRDHNLLYTSNEIGGFWRVKTK